VFESVKVFKLPLFPHPPFFILLIMVKQSIFFPACFLLVSCISLPFSERKNTTAVIVLERDFWDTTPIDGDLVIIGGAGHYAKREDGIKAALLDAARKAAFYESVGGVTLHVEYTGANVFDYLNAIETEFFPLEIDPVRLVEKLRYDSEKDVREDNQSVFIRVRYTPSVLLHVSHIHVSGKKPGWVDNPPSEIGGYRVVVGSALPREKLHNTYIAACENAVFAMINNAASSVEESAMIYSDSRGTVSSFGSQHTGVSRASGYLKGFYVLDTWLDTSTRIVYTLAIVREVN